MNRLSDIIEMGGNLYEEAWNNGRREALKEVQGGKYEKLEETNRSLRAQIDSYERNRTEASKEIDRLTAQVHELTEDKRELAKSLDRVNEENNNLELAIGQLEAELEREKDDKAVLQAKVDSYDGVSREQAKKVKELEEQVHQLDAENDLLDMTVEDLRKKLEWADAKVKEQNEALAIYRVPTPRDCPFCGGPAEVHQLHKDEWYVACGNSDCPVNPETSCFDTEADAIEAWNNSYNAPKVTCDWR